METSGVQEKEAFQSLNKLRADLQHSQDLVSKLESDLENASFNGNGQKQRSPGSSTSSSGGSGASGAGMSAPDANLVALLASGEGKNGSQLSQTGHVSHSGPATGGGGGEGQMLAILTSQRDRYKERLDSMEGRRRPAFITWQWTKRDDLRADWSVNKATSRA